MGIVEYQSESVFHKIVEEEIIETGKRTTIDLGIHGLHPELIRIIGGLPAAA